MAQKLFDKASLVMIPSGYEDGTENPVADAAGGDPGR